MPFRIAIDVTSKRVQILLRLTRIWILLAIVGFLQPARPGPLVGLHREIHWLVFAGAAFLLLLLSRTRRQELCSVTVTFFLGLSLEYLQHLVYHHTMEWLDVRDDALAILVTLALYRSAVKYKAALRLSPASAHPHAARNLQSRA